MIGQRITGTIPKSPYSSRHSCQINFQQRQAGASGIQSAIMSDFTPRAQEVLALALKEPGSQINSAVAKKLLSKRKKCSYNRGI
jgi:hypothetical protein